LNSELKRKIEQILKEIGAVEPRTPQEADRLIFAVSDTLGVPYTKVGLMLMEFFEDLKRTRV
jgi:hypothetical protein